MKFKLKEKSRIFIFKLFLNIRFKNFLIITPFIFFLLTPFILAFSLRRFSNPFNYISNIADKTFDKFISDEVQKDGFLVNLISFSRRENAAIKLRLLEKIPDYKKDLIIYSNHQLKFITRDLVYESIFNLWTADYSITEISDLLSFLDNNMPKALPNKIIFTSITSPNNDLGGSIIGYGNEMPEFMIGYSKNPYAKRYSWKNFNKYIFYPGRFFENLNFIKETKYINDFKFLLGKSNKFLPNSLLNLLPINSLALNKGDISISNSPDIECSFSIDRLGSTIGSQGGCDRDLIFNEKKIGKSEISQITQKDINEIVYSISNIDRIAKKRDLIHILLIPPVFESYSKQRFNSMPNRILTDAIIEFNKKNSNTIIVDHRFNRNFLGSENKKYFYHYDHPSPTYGLKLFKDLDKMLNSKYSINLR